MNPPFETAHEEGLLQTSDGVRLYAQSWTPSSEPKAVVCLVHGGLEHSGRYAHVAKALNNSGYLVAAIDLRGHGRSEGKRAFVRSFDEYLRIPVRTGTEIMRLMAEVNARMGEVTVPLLIFHGTSDGLARPAGSKRLYARAASADKTLRLCEGLFHEVLNEPEHPALLAELVKWLDGHNPSPRET